MSEALQYLIGSEPGLSKYTFRDDHGDLLSMVIRCFKSFIVRRSTASDPNVGIADIEVLANNIHAGAKYNAFLRKRYFNDPGLEEADRVAFTWAAYNAGPARVRSMRKKAKKMGLDPNRWFGNVELAALAIVGQETVRYVSNIYKYYVAYKTVSELRETRQDRKATTATSAQ